MSFVNKQQWTRLERWSANIFFISGGLWLLDTVSLVVNRFLGGTEVTILLEGVSFVIALVATAIGILGLYSRLSDQTPRLAVAGVGGIAAAVGGLVLTILLSVVMASDSGLLDGLFVVSIFALLFGFCCSESQAYKLPCRHASSVFSFWVSLEYLERGWL